MVRISPVTGARTALAFGAVGVAAFVCLGPACTPEEKYRVLTFFFDDVPLPGAATQGAETQPTLAGGTQPGSAATQRQRRVVTLSEHEPFKKQRCGDCHDTRASMRVTRDMVTLCKQCHEDFVESFKFVHAPAATFHCQYCHHPHSSPLPHLLKRPEAVLCFECHDKDAVLAARYHGDDAADACAPCHNPHGADNRLFLVKGRLPSHQPPSASQPRRQEGS